MCYRADNLTVDNLLVNRPLVTVLVGRLLSPRFTPTSTGSTILEAAQFIHCRGG